METVSLDKNRKIIKIFSWILIAISTFVLLKNLFVLRGYSSMITMQSLTKNFDPPIEINFTLYYFQSAVEMLLCVVVFVSATFVLKYKNLWRKALVYCLIVSILFLMISPIINYYNIDSVIIGFPKISRLIWSYFWSIIISAFFIVVIVRLSKGEVKLLFN